MALRDDALNVLQELEAKGRIRSRRTFTGPMRQALELDGRHVHNFSANDYLGLAGDPRLAAAVSETIAHAGTGAGSSRLIMGPQAHEQLEVALGRWLRAPRVQLFNSGYAANVGVLSTLAGRGSCVFSDELNHASIIDGCRLSRANVVVYRHGDLEDLRAKLARDSSERRLVVSETIFSMDGDVADVVGLAQVAREADAALVLDEAHAVGVIGPGGRGVAAEHGVTPDVLVGTLGKAFGSFGAFVAAEEVVIRWLWNRARSLVYSTGLPALMSGAGLRALEIIEGPEGDSLRAQVRANLTRFSQAFGQDVESHIVPWLVGDDAEAVRVSERVLTRGVFVQAIRPPTVAEGSARLRIAIGTHPPEAMDALIAALQAEQAPVGPRLG